MAIPRKRYPNRSIKGVGDYKIVGEKIITQLDGEDNERSFDRKDIAHEVPDTGRAYFNLKNDGTLFGVRPERGMFYVKVIRFAHPENQEPAPRRYEGMGRKKTGESFSYSFEGFTILLEIQRGGWKGGIIPSMLRYLFVDAGDGETAGIVGSGKNSTLLENFVVLSGLDPETDSIPLSENVLPWLEKTIAERDATFMVTVENGYVQAIGPTPEA